MSVMDMNRLVANFLRHEGYLDSLVSFQECAMLPGGGEEQWSSSESEEKRSAIRQLIIQGNMDKAEEAIRERFPSLLESKRRAKAFINGQKFIEMLLAERQEDAIMFARENLAKVLHESSTDVHMADCPEEKQGRPPTSEIVSYLEEVIGLLAYEDPANSPLSHLLSSEHRKKVADVVNTAILEHENVGSRSELEVLLKQLVACQDTLRRMKVTTRDRRAWEARRDRRRDRGNGRDKITREGRRRGGFG
mmetsp:Transcript_35278/g.110231  ORF Transcript_35278/g.110231 Transcript_35278/m.110231 type:complete len:249 (-) Transcript_35278:1005-1751(-)